MYITHILQKLKIPKTLQTKNPNCEIFAIKAVLYGEVIRNENWKKKFESFPA
jgi:hypothetical protein